MSEAEKIEAATEGVCDRLMAFIPAAGGTNGDSVRYVLKDALTTFYREAALDGAMWATARCGGGRLWYEVADAAREHFKTEETT